MTDLTPSTRDHLLWLLSWIPWSIGWTLLVTLTPFYYLACVFMALTDLADWMRNPRLRR